MVGIHRALPAAAIIALLFAAPATARDPREDAKAQVMFGINVAQRGSGARRSIAGKRPSRSIPTYAAAYQRSRHRLRARRQFDKARKAYEKALELEPNNPQIRQNYELFKEINDRTGRAKNP